MYRKIIFMIVFLVCCYSAQGFPQVSVNLSVNKTKAELNDTVEFTCKVTGLKQDIPYWRLSIYKAGNLQKSGYYENMQFDIGPGPDIARSVYSFSLQPHFFHVPTLH